MQQPPMFLWGLRIDEPVTSLTDVLVGVVCLYAWWQLRKLDRPGLSQQYLRYYFLTMGIATILGGVIGHAFLYRFSFAWKLPGWVISMVSVSLVERACIAHAAPLLSRRMVRILKTANIVELLTFMGLAMYTLNFNFVGVHSAFGLLVVVFPLQWLAWRRTGNEGSRLFLVAVGWATVAYVIYLSRWSLHLYYNYLDISHTIMMYCAWLFYKGALLLEERVVVVVERRRPKGK